MGVPLKIDREVTKDNPVYLYKIVKTKNKQTGNGTFKELVRLKAWPSEKTKIKTCFDKMDDQMKGLLSEVDFYYNDRLYRNFLTASNEGCIFVNQSDVWSVWFNEPNDEEALKFFRQLLRKRNHDKLIELREQAWKLIFDQQFAESLVCPITDGSSKNFTLDVEE